MINTELDILPDKKIDGDSAVIIKITGGLGNQYFQYALGKNLELSNGWLVKYDISWFAQQTERKLEINNFKVNIPEATNQEINYLKKKQPRSGKLGWLFNIFPTHSFTYVQEQKLTFNPAILRVKPPIYLDGCWQSEKYFLPIADRLRTEFQVRTEPVGENAKMLAEMEKQEAVAVHFRRGDYVKIASTNKTHGTPTPEYYRRAADYIIKNVDHPIFYIFSDDINWVRENFKLTEPMVFVDQNGAGKGYEDLRLIRACRHHIIANSTFSWWGAWLAEHPGQIVIAPKQWYQSPDMDASDLVPGTWIRM